MQISLSDSNFCLFLLAQFPFAVDDVREITLLDYLEEHFQMPPGDWLADLTGHADVPEAWNGYTYVDQINALTTLFVEFHPNETIYFFNDVYLGRTGGHASLSLLSWAELEAIVASAKSDDLLFLTLLPLAIGNEAERPVIEGKIARAIMKMALQLDDEQVSVITRFLVRHVIFPDAGKNEFHRHAQAGLTTSRNHSERSERTDEETPRNVNAAIATAIA
ncbi:MAG TPA: Imm19 family immunity protein [Devosiaceae bacterium]|jgi:hypothetical protein